MLKLRYTVRLMGAFISRFKGVIFLGVGIGVLAFLALRFIGPMLIDGTAQRIGMTGRFHADSLPEPIMAAIGEGLTKINLSGEVEPALAERWETPDRGKTWVFYLNKNKIWQDGKPITANTIKYSFEDVEVTMPDNFTISFALKTPLSSFPSVVSKPVFKKGLLGTGEWKVEGLSLTGEFIEKITIKNKDGDKKVYKFYPTEDRTKLAFKRGEVDVLEDLVDPAPFGAWPNAILEKTVVPKRHVTVFFNLENNIFKDKALRQALAYAIDKDLLGGERALGPIPPSSWAYNPQIKPYDYDPERARELIEKAPDEPVKLATTPALLPVAEKVAKDWEAVGVKTEVEVVSTIPLDFQALLIIYDTSLDPDQYSTWHSTETVGNIAHYNNPRIDKLLEDGRIELSSEKRKTIYMDFQRFLVEDSPAIFLYHPTSYRVLRR